jgi:putative aldouronate transport system permease protein
VGFEKAFLMHNPATIARSEVIQTYVYKVGILNGQFSLATAIGLFNALVNFFMLATVNLIARRTGAASLW